MRTAPRPATVPSPRAAACHNGQNFERFLAGVKQQAVDAGVSQHAIAEASPYLIYDQGIVNRDRGQRVFGQIFTQFAGRMAAPYRMQQGQQRIQTYAADRWSITFSENWISDGRLNTQYIQCTAGSCPVPTTNSPTVK